MRLIGSISLLLLVWGCAAPQVDPPWVPDTQTIERVEVQVVTRGADLFANAAPLRDYARTYWGETKDGHHIVRGILLAPWLDEAKAGRGRFQIVAGESAAPKIIGNACVPINITYDASRDALTQLDCNPGPPPVAVPPVRVFIVFFESGKANLTADAVAVVSEAMKSAREHGWRHIRVTGHIDPREVPGHGKALSVRRAEAVKNVIVGLSQGSALIETEAKGDSDPMVMPQPGAHEPYNRRVVIDLRD